MTAAPEYTPAFQWFGGKARVADVVWAALGDVDSYVEPFFGSGAVLHLRPHAGERTETINDFDGFVANFWRAVKADRDGAVCDVCRKKIGIERNAAATRAAWARKRAAKEITR